jgi:hypothetical protein
MLPFALPSQREKAFQRYGKTITPIVVSEARHPTVTKRRPERRFLGGTERR